MQIHNRLMFCICGGDRGESLDQALAVCEISVTFFIPQSSFRYITNNKPTALQKKIILVFNRTSRFVREYTVLIGKIRGSKLWEIYELTGVGIPARPVILPFESALPRLAFSSYENGRLVKV